MWQKFNPNHEPAGSSAGGQFAPAGDEGGWSIASTLGGGGIKTAGPVKVVAYRVGEPKDSGRGIFFGSDKQATAAYTDRQPGEVQEYEVTASNAAVVRDHYTLHEELFGRPLMDAAAEVDQQGGSNPVAIVETKMADEMRRRGYDAIIYSHPPEPQEYEIVVINKDTAKITRVDNKGWQKFNPNHQPAGSSTGGQFAPADSGDGGGLVTPFHSDTVDEHGLTNDEYAKMQSWLGTGYRSLRTSSEFGKTLEKLPLFTGKVYRGVRVGPEDLARLKVGSEFEIAKFSSSALTRSEALEYANNPIGIAAAAKERVLMEIFDRGRKIPKEYLDAAGTSTKEIVLMTGDKYKITERDTTTDDAGKSIIRVVMRHV